MVFVSKEHHVEIYPRSNECYANGCPIDKELPDNPLEIVPSQEHIDNVTAETISAVGRLAEAKVVRTTACFLAGSPDGRPVVGLVPNTKNAIIACGGGCWGILNGPAMGQAAADLAVGKTPSIDLSPFDPARFDRSRMKMPAGLPPKLQALIAQNPQFAEAFSSNP